jgi:hypothetical protein
MAATTISYAESWTKVYEAFNQINFTAFDYYSVKTAIVEYLQVYFPESFNDWIETDEFIMLIEAFAYISEQLIYRVDVGSHENFIDVAQRKQSVLRLAKLISYKATRNIPARGLLKVTSVQTSQDIYDSRGNSLKGRTINWSDVNNTYWREQFIDVMNAASSSVYGTVAPADRVQVDNVLYELYTLNNRYSTNGVLPFNINVNGTSYPMEVVSSSLTGNGPVENRPSYNAQFNYLYATDGFGDDSPSTGFFVQTKQGTLTSQRTTFDGITPNQTYDISTNNINDIDFWLNNVNPDTDAILDDGSTKNLPSGEWFEVDTTTAQNVIFSYASNRNRFEIETLENDQVRVIFGDGQFANIPNGTFDFWYRVSANEDFSIPKNTIVDQQFSMSYIDDTGTVQTLQFTASLIANLTNASASETIDHIRANAPAVYYTQNRMVNGQDYNTLFGKDPTILKVYTVNRTFVGDSRYSYWYDASGAYENVKLFGNDLNILFEDVTDVVRAEGTITTATLFANYIVPILSQTDLYNYLTVHKIGTSRRNFTTDEATQIQYVLQYNTWPDPVYIYYDGINDVWSASKILVGTPIITVTAQMNGSYVYQYIISNLGYSMTVQSPTTKFWDANDASLISYETLSSANDQIIILQANINNYGTALIQNNIELQVSGIANGTDGLPDITKLMVTSYDATDANLSGATTVDQLIDPSWQFNTGGASPYTITLPFSYVAGIGEVSVTGVLDSFWEEDPTVAVGTITNKIVINASVTTPVTVYHNSYVYFNRVDGSSPWEYIAYSTAVAQAYALQQLGNLSTAEQLYMRSRGREKMNFLWLHQTPQYHLVDPSMTNIHDVFMIQKGYYNDFAAWLAGTGDKPTPPTPLQLRNDYSSLLVNSMLSDTVVLHSGSFKLVFGDKSIPQLQAQLLVVKNPNSQLTDSQLKLNIVNAVNTFFEINDWDFGETFYYTQLSTAIHKAMPSDISTVVLVPLYPENYFGDMFQVNIGEDEIVQADIGIEDIVVTTNLNAVNMNQVR